MLSKVSTLKGYALHTQDGDIGTTEDFYFDDHHWTVRYLVANTGKWIPGRQVLISPHALIAVDEKKNHIEVGLSKEQIEKSPSPDTGPKKVSGRNERIMPSTTGLAAIYRY